MVCRLLWWYFHRRQYCWGNMLEDDVAGGVVTELPRCWSMRGPGNSTNRSPLRSVRSSSPHLNPSRPSFFPHSATLVSRVSRINFSRFRFEFEIFNFESTHGFVLTRVSRRKIKFRNFTSRSKMNNLISLDKDTKIGRSRFFFQRFWEICEKKKKRKNIPWLVHTANLNLLSFKLERRTNSWKSQRAAGHEIRFQEFEEPTLETMLLFQTRNDKKQGGTRSN